MSTLPATQPSPDVTAVILAMTDGDQPYAPQAIGSVLAQTQRPAVVRVYVQQHNTWIDDVARRLPGFEIRRIGLMPPGQVRNLGAREAETEWVAYLDGDDWWYPRKQERQMPVARAGALVSGCDYHVVDAQGRHATAALCRHIPSASTWLMRRELLRNYPFLPQWQRHDDALWWAHYRAWEFTVRVPELLSAYRIRGDSMSSGTPGKRRKLAVLRWAGRPVVGPLLRLGTLGLHGLFRARRYTAAS
jgi:glycosyltransferase involved in cell wall biosynthesis